jgi:hypothetical protein
MFFSRGRSLKPSSSVNANPTRLARGLDAEAVLASLPMVGPLAGGSLRYGLIWRSDPHLQPRPDYRISLTIAGLRHLKQAQPLCGAFITTIQYLVDQQRKLVPSPGRVVEATVNSAAIREEILSASIAGQSGPPVELIMAKLADVLDREPFLHSALNTLNSVDWEVRVPAVLRQYRDVARSMTTSTGPPSWWLPQSRSRFPCPPGLWTSRTRSGTWTPSGRAGPGRTCS